MICVYIVKYVDDIDYKIHTKCGISQGETLADITKNLSNYYGEDDIITFTITPISDEYPIIEINEEIYKNLINLTF